jgi:DNA-binding IclR family transcriptional regulator
VKDKNFIALIEKLFSLLEAFDENPREPISLERITQTVGMAKTSVHRMLYSLKKLGYLDQHENGNYSLSQKFYRVGRNGLPFRQLTAVAKPILDRLVIRTGESSHIAVLENGFVLFVAAKQSQHAYRVAAEVGDSNYAHSTAVGKCILAFLDPTELESIIALRGLPKLTPLTMIDRSQLALELAKVRNQGYALNNNENIEGVTCVAAPVLDNNGKAVAALSISGPSSRMQVSMENIIQSVKQATFQLSMLLGYRSEVPDRVSITG